MDYGPFLQYTVTVTENADIKTQVEDDESAAPAKTTNVSSKSKKELTLKGTAIKVGDAAASLERRGCGTRHPVVACDVQIGGGHGRVEIAYCPLEPDEMVTGPVVMKQWRAGLERGACTGDHRKGIDV